MGCGAHAHARVGFARIKQESAKSTISANEDDLYQKITALSNDGTRLAIASSKNQVSGLDLSIWRLLTHKALGPDQLSLRSYPSLERIIPDMGFDNEEMFDTDFSEDGSMFLGASSQRIHIWQLHDDEKAASTSTAEPPEPSQVIQSPVLSKTLKCNFRAARFGRAKNSSRLFTIVNATPHITAGGSRKGKRSIERKAFITMWDTQSWNLIKTRTVAKKPVTSFDVSSDGRMLALGGADLSVSIFDADTIRVSVSPT